MADAATVTEENHPEGELRMSLAEHLTELRSRLLKCTLEVEDSRSYWNHAIHPNGLRPKSAKPRRFQLDTLGSQMETS